MQGIKYTTTNFTDCSVYLPQRILNISWKSDHVFFRNDANKQTNLQTNIAKNTTVAVRQG